MNKICLVPLIVPYNNVAHQTTNGLLNCVAALDRINLDQFNKIYYIVPKQYKETLNIDEIIKAYFVQHFRFYESKINFIYLNNFTSSMAETIYEALNYVDGDLEHTSLFIKDADNFVSLESKYTFNENEVLCYSLERSTNFVDTIHKSYVYVDEQGFLMNCIEKRVISDKFISGGYFFKNALDFIKGYEEIWKLSNQHFYISDIIYYLMLNYDVKFRMKLVNFFNDFNI